MKSVLLMLVLINSAMAANPVVIIDTSMGAIEVELNEAKAPISVKNFLGYVKDGFYDKTIFHRVINGFMIQGGGMTADMKEKRTKAPIKNEAGNGLTNSVGTIAMARTGVVDSATSQFFINVSDNMALDHKGESADSFGYAVFGKVTSGLHVVERIKKVKTGMMGGHGDVPMDTVLIKSIVLKSSLPKSVQPKSAKPTSSKPKK